MASSICPRCGEGELVSAERTIETFDNALWLDAMILQGVYVPPSGVVRQCGTCGYIEEPRPAPKKKKKKEGDGFAMDYEADAHLVTLEAIDLMRDRHHDYGDAWRGLNLQAIAGLIQAKARRIQSLEKLDGAALASEGVRDELLDILNYAVFGVMLYDEKKGD